VQSSVEAPVAAVVEPVTHLEPRLGLVAGRDLRTTDRVFRVFRSGGGSHVAHLKRRHHVWAAKTGKYLHGGLP